MNTTSIGGRGQRPAVTQRSARLKRACCASLVASLLIGCGYAWQQASSARTAQRAEQARLAALQMTERKWHALEREAEIAMAAHAFAARLAAEKAMRETPPAAHATATTPPSDRDPNI